MAVSPSSEPRPSRGARRKAETRARLLAAARTLLARQGAEATTINEITEEADVGFGSFYNHFASKEEIIESAVAEALETQGATLDALTGDLDDPAEVVAVAHRHLVRKPAATRASPGCSCASTPHTDCSPARSATARDATSAAGSPQDGSRCPTPPPRSPIPPAAS